MESYEQKNILKKERNKEKLRAAIPLHKKNSESSMLEIQKMKPFKTKLFGKLGANSPSV